MIEQYHWLFENIYYRNKIKCKALILMDYMFKREMKRQNSCYMVSLKTGDFISFLSQTRNGQVYIPVDYLEIRDYILKVKGSYYWIVIKKIKENEIMIASSAINEKQFKIMLKISKEKKT